ncbi:vacuolar sorting-associated 8 homolog, putative [Babesia caballi]|uniref:Vacuolar sorting-associated 8 homolog, putative n=1 Tax=Babesia caballi TaxID=5871 RepID=A0AAV4M2V4_BABCB|nr:vacuolar sorting-associated 8 homolog, putative [Babesia caballi]
MMSRNTLEELLEVSDVSDDSDVDASDVSGCTLPHGNATPVDYAGVLGELLRDPDGDSLAGSTGETSPQTPFSGWKAFTPVEGTPNGHHEDDRLSPTRLVSISSTNSLRSTDAVGCVVTSNLDKKSDLEGQSADRASGRGAGVADEESVGGSSCVTLSQCDCHAKYSSVIGKLVNSAVPISPTFRCLFRKQLDTAATAHKVAYLHKLNRAPSSAASAPSDPDGDSGTESDGAGGSYPYPVLDQSRLCLEELGLPFKNIAAPEKPDLLVRLRHNASAALEKLRLFKDGFIRIDAANVNRLGSAASTPLQPSCIAVSNQLLVVGTSSGSLLVSDISNYNVKRQFRPNDDTQPSDGAVADALVWHEIDSQADASVSYVDVLPESNWICVGYSTGVVKLLQLKKDVVHAKLSDAGKGGGSDNSAATDAAPAGRGFGLMADAMSSAFGGFKKSGSHAVCSVKPFNEPVTVCKFTVGESHDEIICANRASVCLLSYSKTVLSHNLSVKTLDAFAERVLENEDVVDVACLSSNPQSKFITGMGVGGLVALATIKRCVVIATRPELSILFRVPFTDRPKKAAEGACAVPSITWMVLNNSGDIKPVLLIVLGSRISFTLCDTSTGKRGGAPVSCTHLGYIRFETVIRNVHTVSRDMFAAVDFNNVLHVVQVNVFDQVMYYDVVRSFDLGEDNLAEPWLDMVNISPTISVHVRNVKMVANSYKKFSVLVSEMFQAKRSEMFFDLRVASFYILTSKGIWHSEIHSWIKSIGDLAATKNFAEAFAISHALCRGTVPGLLDYKAYIDNIQKLVVYVLHQACAHIIRLSKLMDSAEMTEAEDVSDGWTDKVKEDISAQIDHLCCAMFDICLCLGLYDCLNDLIFRCFATVSMQPAFVKYVLLNFHEGRLDLVQLKPAVFEAVFEFYDKTLDALHAAYLREGERVEDCLIALRDEAEHCQMGRCVAPDAGPSLDARALVYELLCSQLAMLYVFCSRNEINFNKERAVCSLSKHAQWHAFVYCPELTGDDLTVALEILYSEATNRVDALRKTLSPSSGAIECFRWELTEGLFVMRVLYSALNSFLTLENCGLPSDSAVTNFCKVLGYLTSTRSFKPSFPVACHVPYARSELAYDDGDVDFDNMDRLCFETTRGGDSGSSALQMLLATSPRMLFTCFANLLLAPSLIFEEHSEELGSKIDVFNFVVDALVGCLSTLEASQSTFTVRCMLSMFVLGVSAFSESLYLGMRTQVVAIYTLLTEVADMEHDPFREPAAVSTRELILPDGSFNGAYYLRAFCRKADDLLENVRQFNVSASVTRALLQLHIRQSVFALYRKFGCEPGWTQNPHFGNLKRLCGGLLPLACDFETRLFLCEVTGDYGKVISAWESAGGGRVFAYLQQCLHCVKAGATPPECTVNELLLLDPGVQRAFIVTLMDALPRLIRVDLKSATSLLAEVFSLPNLSSVFQETALKSSQDVVLATLQDSPELQLMVLNALLGLSPKSGGGGPAGGDYFSQYLRLLCEHDRGSVCPFLKRQPTLDIGRCLSICMAAGIHDAVSYLLMRAGDFESAARWLLAAFHEAAEDVDKCRRLLSDASSLCAKFAMFTSHETLEMLWFGILRSLVGEGPVGRGTGALVEEVFDVGVLKFARLKSALVELEKYGSVHVTTFKRPLRRLLCDLEFQTFVADTSSEMCTSVMGEEFRRSLDCNKRGVVVAAGAELRREREVCGVCRLGLWSPLLEVVGGREGGGAARTPPQPLPAPTELAPLERQLGVLHPLPMAGEKSGSEAPGGRAAGMHLANLYADHLSTLVSRKPSAAPAAAGAASAVAERGGLGEPGQRVLVRARVSRRVRPAAVPSLQRRELNVSVNSTFMCVFSALVRGRSGEAHGVVPGRGVDVVGPGRAGPADVVVVAVEALQHARVGNLPVPDVLLGHEQLGVEAEVALFGLVLDGDRLAGDLDGPPGGVLGGRLRRGRRGLHGRLQPGLFDPFAPFLGVLERKVDGL